MAKVIKVTPNEKGEIMVTLFGTEYQIVVEKPKKETPKNDKKG